MRKYFNDFDWEIDPIFESLPIKISNPTSESLDEFLDTSDFVIVTYDSTTHLDLVRSGQPLFYFLVKLIISNVKMFFHSIVYLKPVYYTQILSQL